jgi:hypothetical protein
LLKFPLYIFTEILEIISLGERLDGKDM